MDSRRLAVPTMHTRFPCYTDTLMTHNRNVDAEIYCCAIKELSLLRAFRAAILFHRGGLDLYPRLALAHTKS